MDKRQGWPGADWASGNCAEIFPEEYSLNIGKAVLRRLALSVPAIQKMYSERNALLHENASLRQNARNSASANTGLVEAAESGSPFYHYYATFDAIAVMHSHAARDLKPSPQYLTNYLGVKIDPKFIPHILEPMRGNVEAVPIPANWHADIAEWAGALRAVDLAQNSFTVVELGCGWGCWLNITGVAARNRGLKPRLIGIEGDKGHIQFAREACAANGFRDGEVILHHGIAAATGGVALFPRQDAAGTDWGLAPVFGASDLQRNAVKLLGQYEELPMISLKEVVNSVDRVDLLHIDIQGGEADLMEACIGDLSKKVAYTVIGTHSRQIEGRLFETMLNAGWRLEIERPAHFITRDNMPVVAVDGVQGWRNPLLAPSARG